MTSRSEAASGLPAVPVDTIAVRQIIADIDRLTAEKGRRRIDIAHACLSIAGTEIARNARDAVAAKRHGILVASQLKTYIRAAFERRAKPA